MLIVINVFGTLNFTQNTHRLLARLRGAGAGGGAEAEEAGHGGGRGGEVCVRGKIQKTRKIKKPISYHRSGTQ